MRFVEDDWENPTLGAWGLGWEVWLNGMEVTQFTYFQQVGGLDCHPITGEITYGLERLAMYLQGKENVFDLVWTEWEERGAKRQLTYRDVYHQNEVEQSTYNFEQSNAPRMFELFTFFEGEAKRLLEAKLALPGYEMILKAAHTFNLLDARGAISVTERAAYIGRIRTLSRMVAQAYYDSREALGFPMLALGRRAWRHERRATLTVELLTEELPPKALKLLGEAFAEGILDGLRDRGFLQAASTKTPYATPRRLAVKVTHVLAVSPDQPFTQKLMPASVALDADDRPTAALRKRLAGARPRAPRRSLAERGRRSRSAGLRIGRQGRCDVPVLGRHRHSPCERPPGRARRHAREAADPQGHDVSARGRRQRSSSSGRRIGCSRCTARRSCR